MAFMNQERKAKLVPGIKKVCAKYGVKATVSTDRHSISVNIKSGKLDFIGNYIERLPAITPYWDEKGREGLAENLRQRGHIQVNEYHIGRDHAGRCGKFLIELREAMDVGNHDNSDIQSDYFDVGWYTHINIGKWNKPYILEV